MEWCRCCGGGRLRDALHALRVGCVGHLRAARRSLRRLHTRCICTSAEVDRVRYGGALTRCMVGHDDLDNLYYLIYALRMRECAQL